MSIKRGELVISEGLPGTKMRIAEKILKIGGMMKYAGVKVQDKLGYGEDVYAIIKNDHRLIMDDFQVVRDAVDQGQRSKAFDMLKSDLRNHMKAEESYLYPVLRDKDESKRIAVRAQDEHTAAAMELMKIDPNGDWSVELGQLDCLQDMVSTHIRMEESELFNTAQSVIPKDQEADITGDFKKSEGV